MKRLSFFFAGMMLFLFLQQTQAQFPFARHYWINPNSYNHTLYPTSDGGYVLALVRHSRDPKVPFKNSIGILKLNSSYTIQNQQVLWFTIGSGDDAIMDEYVNFDVHDIIEVDSNNNYYVICGSTSRPGEQRKGMVIVVDLGLKVQYIREYEQVEVFYSVYAVGNYYFVCGNMQNGRGVVLRDEVSGSTQSPTSYVTNQSWTYHKIRAKVKGGFNVSGTDGQYIGFTSFNMSSLGTFSQVPNASWQFSQPCNSKAVLTNYPSNALGIILSTSDGNTIYTYLFDNIQNINTFQCSAFEIQYQNQDVILLEDINCSPNKIAWAGNYPNQTAFYASMIKPSGIILPPFTSPTSVMFVNFNMGDYSLHKVHYNKNFDKNFHCGGFYQHYNGDRTTFVVAPEQISLDDESCGKREYENAYDYPFPPLSILRVVSGNISRKVKTWKSAEYDYQNTDCDNEILNQYNKSK